MNLPSICNTFYIKNKESVKDSIPYGATPALFQCLAVKSWPPKADVFVVNKSHLQDRSSWRELKDALLFPSTMKF